MKEQGSTISRRRFLQTAGAGAGMVAAGPILGRERTRSGSRSTGLRVGVLEPTGGEHSSAGANLLEGIRLGLSRSRPIGRFTVRAVEVPLGYAGARERTLELLEGRPNVVIAGVSAPVAARIAPMFEERGVPLVVANVGAHVVRPSSRSPQVLHHGLHYWQSSFAFGTWAPDHVGARAFIAAPISDTGYDTVFAFRRGLESAGGTVVGTFVSEVDGDGSSRAVTDAIQEAGPDFVYGLYSGSGAVRFIRDYRSSGLSTPLTGGGLMADDYLLPQIGPAAMGVRNALPWVRRSGSASNVEFRKAYRAQAGREPDGFGLIGYEAALLVAAGVARARHLGLGRNEIVAALAGATVESPRGLLEIDGRTNTVLSPIDIRKVASVRGSLANVSIGTVAPVAPFPAEIGSLDTPMSSGYLNEYLHAL